VSRKGRRRRKKKKSEEREGESKGKNGIRMRSKRRVCGEAIAETG
jgi:hypothetical protein